MKKLIFIISFFVLFVTLKTNAQALIESTYIPEIGKYEYNIEVPVNNSYTDPYCAGDWSVVNNDWEKFSLKNDNGKYYFTITSFNKIIKFYVSDFKKARAMTKTKFYSEDDKTYHVALVNGQILTETEATFPEPGDYGDGFIRFSDAGEYLLVYFNNNRTDNKGLWPVCMSSANDWKLQYQSISDASGWGSTKLKKSNNKTDKDQNQNNMYFGYGSLFNENVKDILFPNITESLFKNEKGDGLMIPMYFH